MHRNRADQPVLITSAPESGDDELDRRRRRYLLMMALRAVCVLLAAATYRASIWVALACVAAGAILPWCAVIIANDRPPKKRATRPAVEIAAVERALPGASETTVDG